MQDYFYKYSKDLFKFIMPDEALLIGFSGEKTSFVRFNRSKVRQAGDIEEHKITLQLSREKKVVSSSFNLTLTAESDMQIARNALTKLRENLSFAPEDPFYAYSYEPTEIETISTKKLPSAEDITNEILQESQGLDMVGILATGSINKGFSSSFGHKNFLTRECFNLDFACYLSDDKAVKSSYAGQLWNHRTLRSKFDSAKNKLEILSRLSKKLQPGKYKAYLTPAAVDEIMCLINWNGFSKKAIETKSSPLNLLVSGTHSLSPKITLTENIEDGFSTNFDMMGHKLPDKTKLVEKGKFVEPLVSSRSASEYNSPVNAKSERFQSLEMLPGQLQENEILKELGTGIYISNIWYTNYSDRLSGRITGMTRFATFWVENGEIQSPLDVMRFDVSLFELFGKNLIDLTEKRELMLDPSTYLERSNSSTHLPGILVKDFELTL